MNDKYSKAPLRQLFLLSLLLISFLPSAYAVNEEEWQGVIFGYDRLAMAKKHAYENNRPLLVICSMSSCGHCLDFHNKIVSKKEFKDYVASKKIVVCDAVNNGLQDMTKNMYSSIGKFSGAPNIYMFKVKDGANFSFTSSGSLVPKEVELLQNTNTGLYFVGSYTTPDNNITHGLFMGISCGTESNWNPQTFIKQIEAAFPNQCGIPLTPPQEDTSYKDATALTIKNCADINNKPATPAEVVAEETITFKGKTTKWFTFTGRANQRYSLYANDRTNGSSDALTYTIDLFADDNNKLGDNKASIPDKSFKYLNESFFFDIEAAGKYYLRIVSDGANSASATFTLHIHETEFAPTAGNITNPHWDNAVKGKWSMATDKALEAAYRDNKPVLAYFGGATWNPESVCLEQNVLSTDSFKNAIKDYYAVCFDFPPREEDADGSKGPWLLTQTDGYVKTYSITNANKTQQLESNRAWQNKLSVPNINGPIPYPTLVFCRVKQTTRGNYDLEPVGRFPDTHDGIVDITVAETTTALRLFNELLNKQGYSEAVKYREKSQESLTPPPSTATAYVGGGNDTYWFKFPIDANAWDIIIQANDADAAATITASVYDRNGNLVDTKEDLSLKETVCFLFAPTNDTPIGNGWFKIQVKNQKTKVATLNIVCQSLGDITAFVTLPEKEHAEPLMIDENTLRTQVNIPVRIQKQNNNQKLVFKYRVQKNSDDLLWKEKDLKWTVFNWPDNNTTDGFITVNLPEIKQGTTASTLDFLVEIDQQDSCCLVHPYDGNSTTTVKLATKPLFLPRPTETSFTFYKGCYKSITIPVCSANKPVLKEEDKLDSLLPKGLTIKPSDANDCFEIYGIPTEACSKNLTLTLTQYGEDTDTLAITITVQDISSEVLDKNAFIAPLKRDNHVGTRNNDTDISLSIEGMLVIEKNNNGAMSVSLYLENQLTTAETYWEYNPNNESFVLDCKLGDNGKYQLHATMPRDCSAGSATVMFDSSYAGELFPVATPKSPEQFKGIYNVALRETPDYTDQGEIINDLEHGWLQFVIQEDMSIKLTIKLYDIAEELELPYHSYLYLVEGTDDRPLTFAYCMHLGENGGAISGILNVYPPENNNELNPIRVSDCNGTNFYRKGNNDTPIPLSPCGTFYDPIKSIIVQTQTDSFVFACKPVEEDEAVIVPSSILLSADDKDVFTPVTSGVFAACFEQLTMKNNNGEFSLNMNLLVKNNNDKLSQSHLEAKGIFVPTTRDCCGINNNVAIAYGGFTFNEKPYIFRIFPNSVDSTEDPMIVPTKLTITRDGEDADDKVKCELGRQDLQAILFYQRLDTNDLFFKDGASSTVTIDKNTPWRFSAIQILDNPFDTPFYQESDLLIVDNSDMEDQIVIPLKNGWNLIAVPAYLNIEKILLNDVEIPPSEERSSLPSLFTLDETGQSYVSVKKPMPGQAYWLFAPIELTKITFKGTTKLGYPQPIIPKGWSMRAAPAITSGNELNLWEWDNENQKFKKVDEVKPHMPVFIQKE